MVGSYEERKLGRQITARIALLEFHKKYRPIVEIYKEYIEEHREEWNKEFPNYNKLYIITKEMGKIGELREKLEKELENLLS